MASFTRVSGVATGGTANGVTSGSIDTTTADLIIVSASWYPGITADGTLSDSQSNTWIPLTKRTNGSIANRLFYCQSPSTSATNTFQYNGTSIFPSIAVEAWKNSASSPFDVENGASNSGLSTIQTGSITPSLNDELVISGVALENNGGTTQTIDSGFTANVAPYSAGNSEGGGIAYLVQTTATAVNPTWNANAPETQMAATIASFKVSSSPPPSAIVPINLLMQQQGMGQP